MRANLTKEEFHRAFKEYEHTARRLEPRDRYNTWLDTDERVAHYMAGRMVDFSFMNDWTSLIRTGRDQGRLMQRVRIVTEPLTDYIRYTTAVARFNCAAGDDIRYLDRRSAHDLGVPDDEDVWIIDASWALIINFDDNDRIIGFEREDEPKEVLGYLQHWDTAWHYAVTRDEFAARHGVE